MDYVVGSVAALITGNVTPHRPTRLNKVALTPTKHQPSPNVTPKSEFVDDRSIFLSPSMQKKKAIVKKSPKRIFQNPDLDTTENGEGNANLSSPKADKVKKHLKDDLEATNEAVPKSPKSKGKKRELTAQEESNESVNDQVSNENTPTKKKKKLVSESEAAEPVTQQTESVSNEVTVPAAKSPKKNKQRRKSVTGTDNNKENNHTEQIIAPVSTNNAKDIGVNENKKPKKKNRKRKKKSNAQTAGDSNVRQESEKINSSGAEKNKESKKANSSEATLEKNVKEIGENDNKESKKKNRKRKNKSKAVDTNASKESEKVNSSTAEESINEKANSSEAILEENVKEIGENENKKPKKKNRKRKKKSKAVDANVSKESEKINSSEAEENVKEIVENSNKKSKKKAKIQPKVEEKMEIDEQEPEESDDEEESDSENDTDDEMDSDNEETNEKVLEAEKEDSSDEEEDTVNPNAITDKDSDSEHDSDDEIDSENEEINKKVLEAEKADSSDDEEEPQKGEKKVVEKTDEGAVERNTEDEIKRTLFVGNVPFSAKCKKEVKKIFSKHGQIETIRIRTVPIKDGRYTPKLAVIKNELHPERTTVNVYIKYASEESVEKALAENNTVLNDHHLRVSRSSSTGAEHDPKCSIFVGNLPFAMEDEALRAKFEKCGEIHSVRIVRDKKTNAGKGFGYVNFESKDGVELALALTEEDLTVKNRILRVKRCTQVTNKKKPDQTGYNQNNQQQRGFRNNQGQQRGNFRPGNQMDQRNGPRNNNQGNRQYGPPRNQDNRQYGPPRNQDNRQNGPPSRNNQGYRQRNAGGNNNQQRGFNNNKFGGQRHQPEEGHDGAHRRIMNKRKSQDGAGGEGDGPPNKRPRDQNQPNKEKKPRKEFVGMTAEKKKKRKFDKGQKKKKALSEILTK